MKTISTLTWSAKPPEGVATAHHRMSIISALIAALVRLGPQEGEIVGVHVGSAAFEILKVLPQVTISRSIPDSLMIDLYTGCRLLVRKFGPDLGMFDPFKIVLIKLPGTPDGEHICSEINITDHFEF